MHQITREEMEEYCIKHNISNPNGTLREWTDEQMYWAIVEVVRTKY